MEISFFAALLGGIISFLSPCVLPLAPPYLAYLGGTTLDQISGEKAEIDPKVARRVFISAMFFVAGLVTVFVLLGMGASAFGQLLRMYKAEFAFFSGGLIFGLGLHFFGLRAALMVGAVVVALILAMRALSNAGLDMATGPWTEVAWIGAVAVAFWGMGMFWKTDRLPILDREARFDGPGQAGSYGASFVIGIAFAFGWTPCIGPILSAILTLAAQEETMVSGTLLLAVYGLGLGLPFLVAAAFIGPFLLWARGFRRHMPLVEKIMGILLIVVGVAMITGDFERFAYFLLDTFPSLGDIG
ncbi:MAG: cytochrome c biogenesis protein CcdA [Pseudomonadota bacterium]